MHCTLMKNFDHGNLLYIHIRGSFIEWSSGKQETFLTRSIRISWKNMISKVVSVNHNQKHPINVTKVKISLLPFKNNLSYSMVKWIWMKMGTRITILWNWTHAPFDNNIRFLRDSFQLKCKRSRYQKLVLHYNLNVSN